MPTDFAAKRWKQIQKEIQQSHETISQRLLLAPTPTSFAAFLEAQEVKSNHFGLNYIDQKIGIYGKMYAGQCLFVEKGHLYIENIYYPLSRQRFGTRIAIDAIDTYSSHYVEQLIDRKKIHTLAELKSEIAEQFKKYNNSGFAKQYGMMDVDSDFLVIYRDMGVFNYGEIDDQNTARVMRKSFITKNEFKGNQEEIINFILNKLGVEACILTTYAIPRTFNEANNAIEDTLKRVRDFKTQMEIVTRKSMKLEGFKAEKRQVRLFVKYLSKYDPNSV
ncbi:hypothetical protein [Vibrio splendidus]|uniref:hypothetical protein n=1 Tax=Vibrio splendidus TaxID=29497 RepID=UPI0011B1E551|nr:hypothetical protein [Vibrio splendidus]